MTETQQLTPLQIAYAKLRYAVSLTDESSSQQAIKNAYAAIEDAYERPHAPISQ